MKAEHADVDVWSKLREPFPAEQVGKLPKPTKKDNPKGHCDECGKWHGLPAVHLDYVGHADVTGRLLDVDPKWQWEPMAFDEDGLPRFTLDRGGDVCGLWIRLTVCGISRLGYGSVDSGSHDVSKELIGDAIRNAAMRFGIALDLWRKDAPESNDNGTKTVDYGPCPGCKVGKVIRKTRQAGADFAACSTNRYDPKTKTSSGCQWKQWTPDFDALQQRAAADDATTDPAPAAPASAEESAPPQERGTMRKSEELDVLAHIGGLTDSASMRAFAVKHGWKATDGAWSKWITTVTDDQLDAMLEECAAADAGEGYT